MPILPSTHTGNKAPVHALGRRTGGPRLDSAQWDALGRLTQVNNGLGAFNYGYDGRSGRLVQADAALTGATVAGLRTSFTYGAAADGRQLTGIIHQKADAPDDWSVSSQHSYGYDAHGRLSTWQHWAEGAQRTWNLTQDADDQLTGVNEDGNAAFAYTYDPSKSRNHCILDLPGKERKGTRGNRGSQ